MSSEASSGSTGDLGGFDSVLQSLCDCNRHLDELEEVDNTTTLFRRIIEAAFSCGEKIFMNTGGVLQGFPFLSTTDDRLRDLIVTLIVNHRNRTLLSDMNQVYLITNVIEALLQDGYVRMRVSDEGPKPPSDSDKTSERRNGNKRLPESDSGPEEKKPKNCSHYSMDSSSNTNTYRTSAHIGGVYCDLEVDRRFPATAEEISRFHGEEYMQFIQQAKHLTKQMVKFNVGDDCPPFDGLFEFCQLSSGAFLAAVVKLNKQKADIAVNWMGGLHHAKKSEASGFCYTNDIVRGILELLKYHRRMLYVDIDVHHGDGVDEAFYITDRVMTVSSHKYGDFFPGTGHINDIGAGKGKNSSLNVPLKDGITDDTYQSIFEPVMQKVMDRYQPCAVVLQCGEDSLNGDRLGPFNLTLRGHRECVKFFRELNIPLMMVGGGGYTPSNVARCWTYETALAVDRSISNELPHNDYYGYFGPNYHLHIHPSNANNENSSESLKEIQETVIARLNDLTFAPSVQMQPVPADALRCLNDGSLGRDMADPDKRLHRSIMDNHVHHPTDYYDTETEGDDRRNDHNPKRAAEEDIEMLDRKKAREEGA